MIVRPGQPSIGIGRFVAAALVLAAMGGSSLGGSPLGTAFTYQGKLDQNGTAVADTCDVQFSLWDDPAAGTQVGPTLVFAGGSAITVADGLFTATLDFGPGVLNGDGRWLQIEVACPSGGPLQVLSPRQPITAAPYALFALDGASAPALWGTSGISDIFYEAGKVAIGHQAPLSPLDVRAGVGTAIRASSSGASGRAVEASATASNGIAIVGQTSSPLGIGVEGIAVSTSGSAYGVYGVSHAPGGRAVNAWAGHDTGTSFAVRALTSSPNGYAGYFEGGRNYFEGNVGIGTMTPSVALQVVSASGKAAEVQGTLLGMDGIASHSGAVAVRGQSTALSGFGVGVFGITSSPDGYAVVARQDGGSGTGKAVFGLTFSPDGYAGYFEGGRNYFEGNVGIGTENPQQKLHVSNGSAGVAPNTNSTLVVERDNSTFINILTPDVDQCGILFGNPARGSAAGGVIYNSSNTPNGMQFRVNGNSVKMTITEDGDVGIGTTSPGADLHVRGTTPLGQVTVTPGTSDASSQILMTENTSASLGALMRYDGTANQWQVLGKNTGGETTPHMVVGRDNGRVGIGTASPATALHVNGDVRVDGSLTVPPTTRTLMLPASSFEHVKDFDDLNIGFVGAFGRPILSNRKTLGADRSAGATVTLPQGAVVKSLTAWVNDTALGQAMAVYLEREKFGNTSFNADTMASVLAIGSGVHQVTDDTIAFATVENTSYMYWVTARFREGAPAHSEELHGVRIVYEISSPLP